MNSITKVNLNKIKGNELLQKGIQDEALIYFKLDIKTNPYHVKSYISISL